MSSGFVLVPDELREAVSWRGLLAYVGLRSFADRSGMCWPSYRAIAAAVNVSASTVRRGCEELESVGWLSHDERVDAGGQTSNVWFLRMDTPLFSQSRGAALTEQRTRSNEPEPDADENASVCLPLSRNEPAHRQKKCDTEDCPNNTGIDYRTGERYPYCQACSEGTIRSVVQEAPFMAVANPVQGQV